MLMGSWTRNALVVEDEALISGLLVQALESHNFEVKAASSAVEAKRILQTFEPDLALLDIDLGPGPTGIDVAHIINSRHKGTGIIFLTKYPDARSAGIDETSIPAHSAFLRKELVGKPDVLLKAIDTVLVDEREVRQDREPDRPLAALSKTQMEVLRLLASGYTNAEIARRRNKTLSSVEQLLKATFTKLGIQGTDELNPRIEAVRMFIRAAGIPNRDN
jgi:DNA-binding NarL/FixJ family response regulator